MPPEIGLVALVFGVLSFVLSMRTRRELFGGGRSGRPGLFDRSAPFEHEPRQSDAVARALRDLAASNLELSRRLENLESIVTAEPDAARTRPLLDLPPEEPTAAERAETLARRLRG